MTRPEIEFRGEELKKREQRLKCLRQLRSCVKVEVAILGSQSSIGLPVRTASVDVKQH